MLSEWFLVNKSTKSASGTFFLVAIFLIGISHWLLFFYLEQPPHARDDFTAIGWMWDGDRELFRFSGSPSESFGSEAFTAHDWYTCGNYLKVVREALQTGIIPYHVSQLHLFFSDISQDRFLGVPAWSMSPQVVFLYLLDPFTFAVVNLLLMYSIGFYGCLLIRREYGLGMIAFTFLFLLFNFNGYFVAKVAAHGPSQLGYFLFPFLVLFLMRAGEKYGGKSERDATRGLDQAWLGLLIGLVLAGMLYQGSLHFFVECLTFVLLWGVINFRKWRLSAVMFLAVGLVGAVRLLPAAVTYGAAPNPHAVVWGGYGHPGHFVQALVSTRTHLSHPLFTWWESDLYVGLVGLLALIYFGVWGSFLRCGWAKFTGWYAMAVPLLVITFISFRQFKKYVVPDWIPLLNAESMTTRYMIIPLVVLIVIATINLQGFCEKYLEVKRIKYLLLGSLLVVGAFLFNHSRVWRMHRVQDEYDWAIAEGLDSEPAHHSMEIALRIQNHMDDTLYIWAVWGGAVVTTVSIIVIATWIIRQWHTRPKINGFVDAA